MHEYWEDAAAYQATYRMHLPHYSKSYVYLAASLVSERRSFTESRALFVNFYIFSQRAGSEHTTSSCSSDCYTSSPNIVFAMSRARPDNESFNVGWVCALDIEVATAQAMLDQEFEPPVSIHAGDSNTYTLGNIGVHNVVIASLPAGSYGETSAAVVATSMLASFPNIRFGLMVGIGGGIPSKRNDIRLGDVVVSQPQNTNGT